MNYRKYTASTVVSVVIVALVAVVGYQAMLLTYKKDQFPSTSTDRNTLPTPTNSSNSETGGNPNVIEDMPSASHNTMFQLDNNAPYGATKVYVNLYVPGDMYITYYSYNPRDYGFGGIKILSTDNKIELDILPVNTQDESIYKPFAVLPGSVNKVGIIKAGLSKNSSDIYRVAYQTDENMFYTNNYRSTGTCAVASYRENAPCAWLFTSLDTKSFVQIIPVCRTTTKAECLNRTDGIVSSLWIYN